MIILPTKIGNVADTLDKEREMKYVMLNREDIFKIIALFESEQTLELVRVGSLTCYANLTQEQLNILDKNHFGYTLV